VDGMPALDHINYSPPFQAPLPVNVPSELFAALVQFSKLLKRPEGRYTYRLQEGDAVLFDNRRILHARMAFRELQDHERPKDVPRTREGESSRWLKGCYLEADALLDRVRVLEAQLEGEVR
jgi:gamma-butyrobetaine dioxygenase